MRRNAVEAWRKRSHFRKERDFHFREYLAVLYSEKVRISEPLARAGILTLLLVALIAGTRPAFSQPAQSAKATFADSFDLAFGQGDPLRNIIEPIFLGEQSFSARLEALKAETGDARPPLGLVLCGGSARAYAHIGVLRALEAAQVYPDFIVASSMGAIVGMLYATGFSPDDIQLLINTLPLESSFRIVLPTNGGLIDTTALRATIRAIAGDIDISRTAIPIIVTAEDLITRQQTWIAEGPFDRAMTSAFAMPAIIEPQRFGEFELIDAGATTIAPVEPALRFTDRLIVSTAFYDRIQHFSSPITVLNRAVDIGKTRAGMKELEGSDAFVIRNDVENLSYMQFSDPELIISKGKSSADAALSALGAEARAFIENPPPAGFSALRAAVHAKLVENLQRIRSGYMPASEFVLRGAPTLKLFSPYLLGAGEPGAEPRLGLACAMSVARIHASLGYFAALAPEPSKDWALESSFEANPFAGLATRITSRLWGAYGSTYLLEHDPRYWELAVLVQSIEVRGSAAFGFRLGGEFTMDMGGALTEWRSTAQLHTSLVSDISADGPRAAPWYSLNAGGFVENSTGSSTPVGVEGSLMAGLESMWLSPGIRASAKISLNAEEFSQNSYDGFRSGAPRSDALASLITNTELAFAPRNWYLDVAEAVLIRKFKLGPIFDTRWDSSTGKSFRMTDWAAGASFSCEARAFGLAPATLSLFASYTGSKVFSLQFKTGLLIEPRR